MLVNNHLIGFGIRRSGGIQLVIAADQNATGSATGYNVFTAAGSPASPVAVTVTVNSGVKVVNMRALGFPAGSTLTIINNGNILGNGGVGADTTFGDTGPGPGTDAIRTNVATTITNNGNIWAGGGGGAAGGYGIAYNSAGFVVDVCQSGGGGGAGANGGAAGGGNPSGGSNGSAGASYPSTGGGAGGPGRGDIGFGAFCGDSGAGGDYGQPGGDGGLGYQVDNTPGNIYGGYQLISPAFVAGAAGKSVNTQGAGVTWISGNNGTQVKGSTA